MVRVYEEDWLIHEIHSCHNGSRGVTAGKHISINFETTRQTLFSSISPSRSSVTRLAKLRSRVMLTHHWENPNAKNTTKTHFFSKRTFQKKKNASLKFLCEWNKLLLRQWVVWSRLGSMSQRLIACKTTHVLSGIWVQTGNLCLLQLSKQ